MPTTLPIPSKGALRTLRHLALGTSFTVALSTGLLTEERRRRIQLASEVHDNAKRLKASRQYHSAGSAVTEHLEERVMRYKDGTFWPTNESGATWNIESAMTILPPDLQSSNSEVCLRDVRSPVSAPISKYQFLHPGKPLPRWKGLRPEPSDLPLKHSSSNIPSSNPGMHNRQHELAYDISKMLESMTENEAPEAAASRFFDAFEEGLLINESGIVKELVDVAAKLSKACRDQLKFDLSSKILDIILNYGPIDEDQFHSFSPLAIIDRLMRGPLDKATGYLMINDSDLRKASALYLTKFKEKPGLMSPWMRSLGERLCAATCRSGMYDVTIDLYWRLDAGLGDKPKRASSYLIKASHARGDHNKLPGYFRRFYAQTSPNQEQFSAIVGLVIDSLQKLQKFDKAEKVLIVATRMAEKGGLLTSTTWLLQVLGREWRTNCDLFRARSLFDRLETLSHVTKHPQALYSTIIQICVEAGEEAMAQSYYRRLKMSPIPNAADLSIYGHFALAKAMRNDWGGVKEDFRNMCGICPDKRKYNDIFTPILKVFAKSHPVSETEEFLRNFIEDYQVSLTPYMSNLMISAYAKAGEMDSLFRWVEYAASSGTAVDAVSFNTILKNCYEQWKFSFEEIYQLYESVRKLRGPYAFCTNAETVSTLQHIAIAASGDNIAQTARKLNLLKLGVPIMRGVDSRGIQLSMATSIAKGNPARALKIYRRTLIDQNPLHPRILSTAIKASLHLHGRNIKPTAALLQDAQRKGQDVRVPLASVLIFQVSELDKDSNTVNGQVEGMVRRTVIALEELGIGVPVAVLTHTVSILVKRGQHRKAIDLWTSMSRIQGLPSTSIDLVTLTVLLRAYIGLQDSAGIKWVLSILAANDLIPDKRFRLLLKNTRATTEQLLKSPSCHDCTREFHAVVVEVLQQVSTIRAHSTEAKENAKLKTIKIIENAVQMQTMRERSFPALPGSSNGNSFKGRTDVLKVEPTSMDLSEESLEAWMESDIELDFSLGLPTQRLVSATAA